MGNGDTDSYLRFCTRSNLDKYFHQLEGTLRGILMDGVVSPAEADTLRRWRDSLGRSATRAPFREVVETIDAVLADDKVEPEEVEDLLWVAQRFTTPNQYYDAVSSDIQRLHGIIFGFLADGELTDDELLALKDWLDQHDHLRQVHPYEELCTLLMMVFEDGVVDEGERRLLHAFLADLAPGGDKRVIQYNGIDLGSMTLPMVCATNVDIPVPGKLFCFTGKSTVAPRKAIAQAVRAAGGEVSPHVTQSVDFLVVGSGGNPCWAFAKYGRKIEKAMSMRRAGSQLMIVNEVDFWDALEDYR